MAKRAFLLLLGFLAASPGEAFDFFEHRAVGNTAFQLATSEFGDKAELAAIEAAKSKIGLIASSEKSASPAPIATFDQAARLLELVPLQFGDLAALAGDFAPNPPNLRALVQNMARTGPMESSQDGLFARRRADAVIVGTRRQWLSACKWIYRARSSDLHSSTDDVEACFGNLTTAEYVDLPRSVYGTAGYRSDRSELAEFEGVPYYVSLASQNGDHFPRYAWKVYADHHLEAMKLARRIAGLHDTTDEQRSERAEMLAAALILEGFAQHFLQDSFAAGHIGTQFSKCRIGRLLCEPTKERVQQTHDVLNEIGLRVSIADPAPFLQDLRETVVDGWTSFGDGHLFVKESDFHRAVLIRTARASISELLKCALRSECAPDDCPVMCSINTFPIPDRSFLTPESVAAVTQRESLFGPVGALVEFVSMDDFADIRSKDLRVPSIPVEGWKVAAGFVRQFRSNGGTADAGPKIVGGIQLKLDYVRNIGPNLPNLVGLEYYNYPNRGSDYLLTIGFSAPKEHSSLQVINRLKAGWRLEDSFTKVNPTPNGRTDFQITVGSIEGAYAIYKPIVLFFQVDYANYLLNPGRFEWIGRGKYAIVLGVKFDLAGVN